MHAVSVREKGTNRAGNKSGSRGVNATRTRALLLGVIIGLAVICFGSTFWKLQFEEENQVKVKPLNPLKNFEEKKEANLNKKSKTKKKNKEKEVAAAM